MRFISYFVLMIKCPFCGESTDESISTCQYCWNLLDNNTNVENDENKWGKTLFIVWLVGIIVIFLIFFLWALSWLFSSNRKIAENNDKIESLSGSIYAEYCVNNSWSLDISVDDEWNVSWVCGLSDGTTCDLIEFFRWDCSSSDDWDDLFCSDESECEDENVVEESSDFNTWINEINSITWDIDVVLWDWTWNEDLYDYFNEEFSDDSTDWNGRILIDDENSEESEDPQKNICLSFWWIYSDWKCMLWDWNMLMF